MKRINLKESIKLLMDWTDEVNLASEDDWKIIIPHLMEQSSYQNSQSIASYKPQLIFAENNGERDEIISKNPIHPNQHAYTKDMALHSVAGHIEKSIDNRDSV